MLSEIKFSYYQGMYTEESQALSKLRLEVPDEMGCCSPCLKKVHI